MEVWILEVCECDAMGTDHFDHEYKYQVQHL